MEEKKIYIAADKSGEVFVYNELPKRHASRMSNNKEIYWVSNGDEEMVLDAYGYYTAFGRLMNIPEDLMFNIKWEDEPIEINVSVTKK